MPISIFGFQALWSPVYLGIIVFFTILYFLITVKWRKEFAHSEPLKVKEIVFFLSGMVLLYALKGSPVDLMGHILFTVHMVQMALMLLLVPALLIMGIPAWLWKVILELPVIKPMFRFFAKPLFALILFSLLFSLYHLPEVFDFVKTDMMLHGIVNIILFISAFFLWWPVVNQVEGTRQLHGLKKIGYLFGLGILLTPACALIIFGGNAFYETYTNGEAWMQAMALCVPMGTLSQLTLSGPELFTDMSALQDQRTGGIIMKILQELIFAVFLGTVFAEWFRNETKNADDITAKALKDREQMAYHRHNA
ncbi:cytochrome c oxidase assembly factor CtaG [Planomicrobium sp. YIM 101495]|uniref:cytochrome c oxidase assembly factor CtaG n=1 Tax=Planomicrobium sp. YIM 101495 TaxID=2665160 RepID=UPI0012B8E960|nr:cytochrome c oxidase assembly factor CtaG [Planomicrobium sp. YIM 101495]MTD30355.1 cytochrome c oxidase assembly factor CtaG [Planomicrobium sp. YIM 101495]